MSRIISSKKPFMLWPYALPIVCLTVLAYTRVYFSEFISWDDPELILNNKAVHNFDVRAFFTGSYIGNYMPLTMLVHALGWRLFHDSSMGHHLLNVLLHGLDGILVFMLTYKLFKDNWKALLAALIFCLHPVQTESVFWVSEAKTLLFSFFFLWGLIQYTTYLETQRLKTLCGPVLLLFILSVLSKPAAICFPLCLLCMDLIFARPLHKKGWIEKIPFFVISLAAGLFAVYTQQQDKFINASHEFAWYQRIGYAGYALASYLGSFLLPVNQSVIYPYPQNHAKALIIGFLGLLMLGVILYRLWKRKKSMLLGIILFIISNLLLVLQFVPFGEVLTADRYMYLPVLGFAWLLLYFITLEPKIYKAIACAVVLILGVLTFSRSKAWQDSIALYSDILDKYPDSYVALNSLGTEHMLHGNTKLAYTYLNRAVANSPQYYKSYYNRGLLNMQTNQTTRAISDFTKAIELKQYVKAYVGRANVYYQLKDFSKAIADGKEALRLDPANIKADVLLANCYADLDQLDQAIYYYNAGIAISPAEPLFYLQRAILYGKGQHFDACLRDLDACTKLDPACAEAYYWKGVAKFNMKQDPCGDFREAYRLGFKEAEGAVAKFCR